MEDSAHPRFFDHFPMRRVTAASLDDALKEGTLQNGMLHEGTPQASTPVADGTLRIVFLWGKDCPNCDIAKGQMLLTPERFTWPDVEWLHDNVYEDPAMATRMGLHGIPAFFVYRGSTRLGRMSQWPGTAEFVQAIERLRAG